jgi:hypothetical protein
MHPTHKEENKGARMATLDSVCAVRIYFSPSKLANLAKDIIGPTGDTERERRLAKAK